MTSETINELEGTVKRADQLEAGDLVVEVPEYGKPAQPMRVVLAHPFKDNNNNRMVLLVLDAFDGREPLHVRARAEAKYDTAGVEQEWLFTFGAGQTFDGRFVRIFGSYESARARMNRVFGHAWCAQYDWRSFDAMGLPSRVTELPATQWPASVEAARPELLRDWHFTFGFDHTLPDGTRLANRYVRMRDMTCDDSRAVMLAHFGNRWSNQYPSAEAAGVERFGLELLPSAQWPEKPADKPEAERDWYFAFPAGSEYAKRYVRVRGTEFAARKRMRLVFGHAWHGSYDYEPAKHEGLTELPESQWPAAPNDALIAAVDKAFLPTRDEQRCPTTGAVLGNIATIDGRWVCCRGQYPDHAAQAGE